MKTGTLVSRHCVVTLKDSSIVVDWGNGTCQDVSTGQFMPLEEKNASHTTLDEELQTLKKSGLVSDFDGSTVHFTTLPDVPKKTIE
jgi:hypothetical protein